MSALVTYTSSGQQGPFIYSGLTLVEGQPHSSQVAVYVNDSLRTEGIHYTLDEAQTSVYFIHPYPSAGHSVDIRRQLDVNRLYSYEPGQALNAAQLNANYDHLRLLSENMTDYSSTPLPTRQASNLYELRDVDQSVVPQEGDTFGYSVQYGKWRAQPFAASIYDLQDVDDPGGITPKDGAMLAYRNERWEASNYRWNNWDPYKTNQVWGDHEHSVAFMGRPLVSNDAILAGPPEANEIPTARDVAQMVEEAQVLIPQQIAAQTAAMQEMLQDSDLEAAMLSAVEWKYGIRFSSWQEYKNSTSDWPELNGGVSFGDTLPDGSDAIIRNTVSNVVTSTGGPTFTKNPNRRFLPTKLQGRSVGGFILDPGAYISYPQNTGTLNAGTWIRDLAGLVKEVGIKGFRGNAQNDFVLTVGVELECAQSTKAIKVLTDRWGMLPTISDYAGALGIKGVYDIKPLGFSMNIPSRYFAQRLGNGSGYQPLVLKIYGDRSLNASINTTS